MAIALLAGTLLAIAGFLLTCVQGFVVASHLAAASPAARLLVTKHVAYAIPTMLLSLFSQSMVIFFFIGTGRLVKDEIAGYTEEDRRSVLDVLRGFKRRDLRPALGDCRLRPRRRRAHEGAPLLGPPRRGDDGRDRAPLGALGRVDRLHRERQAHGRSRGLRPQGPGRGSAAGRRRPPRAVSEAPLAGKTALVTGAGVRVGRAIALALAEAGADVAVHYRGSAGPAEDVARRIRRLGRRAATISADLSRPDDCRALVQAAARELGGVDLLVHSAASFHRESLEETDEAVWGRAMDLNARAGFLMAREAAADLRRRHGRVVLISDFIAETPLKNYLAHSVSKAAVEGLVRALAVELAPEVSVNGVAPGTVLVPDGTAPEVAARWADEALLRRNGDPEDVAATVVFLCAGPAFLTGQVLRVDGGKSLT